MELQLHMKLLRFSSLFNAGECIYINTLGKELHMFLPDDAAIVESALDTL